MVPFSFWQRLMARFLSRRYGVLLLSSLLLTMLLLSLLPAGQVFAQTHLGKLHSLPVQSQGTQRADISPVATFTIMPANRCILPINPKQLIGPLPNGTRLEIFSSFEDPRPAPPGSEGLFVFDTHGAIPLLTAPNTSRADPVSAFLNGDVLFACMAGYPSPNARGTVAVFVTNIRLALTGGTEAQLIQLLNVWDNTALRAFDASLSPANQRFITWFGAYDSRRFAYVIDTYTQVFGSMRVDQYTIHPTGGPGCGSSTIAYSYYSAKEIFLCQPFWTEPTSGVRSKTATLLHEVTHTIGRAEDINNDTYSPAQCKTLAREHPDEAIRNASNYQFFAVM